MQFPTDIHQGKILIVDDQAPNVLLLERMLRGAGYTNVSSTTHSSEVCALHAEHGYDLIMLDLHMPVMDGFQVMEGLKSLELDAYLPVLVITAQPELKLRALRAGAKDFVSKPFDMVEVLARVHNMLEVRLLHQGLHDFNAMLELRVRERTSDLHDGYVETIFAMTRAAEHKDEDTGSHVQRISYYCRELAQEMGQNAEFVDRIFIASPMHDIGKIGIPDHILLKNGGFTPPEWDIMKTHAIMGAEILGNSKSPYLRLGAEIALNHHERWDGGGYPNGKCGEDIPLAARIMNICDIYDALRSARPYKLAFNHQKTMDIITVGDGRTRPDHFDPQVMAAFVKNSDTFQTIFDTLTSEPVAEQAGLFNVKQ
ncbi:response regulator [Herbaspirillum sp. RTI4]|uniref:HD domain-containing phosphohydrolase n=1 Tax=Herbaspirillum sp. RTI4 TaxID=3048640 RepID=UPI002AB3C7E2|nr:HD domain-containing phosphohydrolase [Herbaspirillum sp. RTI4]MDY7578789.1 response regulator [Herbaspirillum sp. RTI4]MEA9982290.1 response regulator [Herbaspirillum sp. RTI4]